MATGFPGTLVEGSNKSGLCSRRREEEAEDARRGNRGYLEARSEEAVGSLECEADYHGLRRQGIAAWKRAGAQRRHHLPRLGECGYWNSWMRDPKIGIRQGGMKESI